MTRALPLFAVLLAAACASSRPEARAGQSALTCGIADPQWRSAVSDFDRQATLALIAGLSDAARDGRARLHAGSGAKVGDQLDALDRQATPNGFVSEGVAELGRRLRQLECAVKGGLAFDLADQRYAAILGELAAERATLDPAGGSTRSAAR